MQSVERKYRDRLRIGGMALIAFGIWSIIKILLQLFDMYSHQESFGEFAQFFVDNKFWVFTLVIIISLIELALRFFVGRSAVKESEQTKGRKLYLILLGLIALSAIYGLVIIFQEAGTEGVYITIARVIFEIATLIICADIYSAVYQLNKIVKRS